MYIVFVLFYLGYTISFFSTLTLNDLGETVNVTDSTNGQKSRFLKYWPAYTAESDPVEI